VRPEIFTVMKIWVVTPHHYMVS